MKKTILIAALPLFITACGDKVSMGSTEEQRTMARNNSKLIAMKFVAENPKYSGFSVVPNGDSTITRDCPQGDGWASLSLINQTTGDTVPIKCSTYSIGIGCLVESKFNNKTNYKQQEGTCNNDLDYPIPKVAN